MISIHGRWKCLKVGEASSGRGHGERVECEPITGVCGRSPQRGPGAEPLVGGQGAKPPWSWKLFGSWTSHCAAKLIPLSVFSKVFNRFTGLLPKFSVYGSNWVCRPKMNRFLRNKQLDGKYNTRTIDDMPRKCLVLNFFGGIGVIPPIPTSVTVAWSVGPWQ